MMKFQIWVFLTMATLGTQQPVVALLKNNSELGQQKYEGKDPLSFLKDCMKADESSVTIVG